MGLEEEVGLQMGEHSSVESLCQDKVHPSGEDSPAKRTRLFLGNYEKNSKEVPRSCFVGVAPFFSSHFLANSETKLEIS